MSFLINWLAGIISYAFDSIVYVIAPLIYFIFDSLLKILGAIISFVIDLLSYLWMGVLYILDVLLVACFGLTQAIVGNGGFLNLADYGASNLTGLMSASTRGYVQDVIYTLNGYVLLQCLDIYISFLVGWGIYRFVARWVRG